VRKSVARIVQWMLLLMLCAQPAHGADQGLEKRAGALAAQLRCLVCQNQSIADSNARLALDLKQQIHEQLAAGRSDQQVINFMVERYGDFVLYRPPFKPLTWLLWCGPLLLLVAGAFALARVVRAQRVATTLATHDELVRGALLLDASLLETPLLQTTISKDLA
jgi:cytochrome c-type biogenesis protein CcmH